MQGISACTMTLFKKHKEYILTILSLLRGMRGQVVGQVPGMHTMWGKLQIVLAGTKVFGPAPLLALKSSFIGQILGQSNKCFWMFP